MKTNIWILILIIHLLPCKNFGQTIIGKVLDSKDKEEIFFAPVYLYKEGQLKYSAKTTVDGSFAFYKIKSGQYKLFLPCTNCKQDTLEINLASDSTFNLTLYLKCEDAICLSAVDKIENKVRPKKIKVYKDLNKALKHPEKVIALDLRGKDLEELGPEINKFKNLEFLWLSAKLRNLWFYPKAWPYKFFGKQLPGGGYAHLEGRGRGQFYLRNNLKTLPNEIKELKSLKVIDICETSIQLDEWLTKLREINPDIIVLSYRYEPWVVVEAEFDKYEDLIEGYKLK